jgi:excisionase family DNA binding protein
MTEPKVDEKHYRASEVEKMLGVSHSTMKRWIRTKKIRAVKFGSNWRISESAIAEFKEKAAQNTEMETDQ